VSTALGWVTGLTLLSGAALIAVTPRNALGGSAPTRHRDVVRSGWRLYRLALFYFITFGGFVAMFLLLPTALQDGFDFSRCRRALETPRPSLRGPATVLRRAATLGRTPTRGARE
jgi:nitrate/nitrite transporter NarK